MTSLLTIDGLEVSYQRVIVALHGISLTVSEGQIVALLGANGAGKSTTLRAISGFIGLDNARVTKGEVRYRGEAIHNLRPPQITKRGIVLVPEREKVFPNLTVSENLAVVISKESLHERRRRQDFVYSFFPRLGNLRSKEAGLLSGGERQMLAIGAAIVCAPELLLIDELSMGLAPVIIDDLIERLLEIRRELNITLLLVEQSASVVLNFVDYAYVLENGHIAMEGSAKDLRDNEDIQKVYLGVSAGERASYRDARERRQARQNNA
jgi:branched-chain amino acid transport system ATP-binding protein